MNLGILLGAATDSFREARRMRQEKEQQEWYRKFQEDMKEFNQWLQKQAEKREQDIHPYTLYRLGKENELRDLDIGFRKKTDPLRVEGLKLSNLLAQQEHEQRGLSFEEDMLLKEWERKLAEQRYRQGEQLFPVQLQLSQADLARKLEEAGPEVPGIGIPLDDAQRKKMFLDLYNFLDEYNVGSEYLADIQKYEDILLQLLGDEMFYSLLAHAQKYGPQRLGRNKEPVEVYFGRRYKPGNREYSPITGYLKYLRIIP